MAAIKYPTSELYEKILGHERRIGVLEVTGEKRDERIGSLEQGGVKRNERIGELRKDIDRNTIIVEALREVVATSGYAIKIGTWIIGLFGASVIALIWSLITGQASIVFK